MTGLERVGLFLVEMAARSAEGAGAAAVLLMLRYDIVDCIAHLGGDGERCSD